MFFLSAFVMFWMFFSKWSSLYPSVVMKWLDGAMERNDVVEILLMSVGMGGELDKGR